MSVSTAAVTRRPDPAWGPRPFGSGAESHLDAMCRTAAALLGLPAALVSRAGAEGHRIEAACGLPAAEAPRAAALCAQVLLGDEVLVVEDAAEDPRVSEAGRGRGSFLRFFAGVPLILAPGLRLGVLAVLGPTPRRVSPEERARLADLAAIVGAHLRLRHTEAVLRTSEAHFRLLAESASDMIVLADADTTRRYVSPASLPLLGYAPEELVGTRPIDGVHPDDAAGYRALLDRVSRGEADRVVGRQRYRRKDGRFVWVEATFSVMREGGTGLPTGYVAAVRDISERKEAESRIAHLALHDALTGLPNRLLLRDRLQQELALVQRYGGAFALLCLDLDHFKEVNDRFGHAAGDALLCAAAERIRRIIRTEDTAARIGGDEFVILQTRTNQPVNAEAMARRLIEALHAPFALAGFPPLTVGVSIGVAFAPRDSLDGEGLYRLADQALYAAKAAGRGVVRLAPHSARARAGA